MEKDLRRWILFCFMEKLDIINESQTEKSQEFLNIKIKNDTTCRYDQLKYGFKNSF